MLTDAQCRNATCPADKPRARLADSGGLYLEVSPAGAKRWFWKYRREGKEGRLALGSYPATALTAARKARDVARLQKADGHDPVEVRLAQRAKLKASKDETFAAVAQALFDLKAPGWSATHRLRCEQILKQDLVPKLGARPIGEITTPELITALRPIEARDTLGTLAKARSVCGLIWGYAVSSGVAQANIAKNLSGVFKAKPKRHFPAITDPGQFGNLLRHINAYHGGPVVKAALQLAPLLFQRPGELRSADWTEFDLDAALWTVPASRMKRSKDGKETGDPHLVPLPRQAVAILRGLHPLTGHGQKVFPSQRDHTKPISENALRVALMALGFQPEVQTVHGFRASARTMLAEQLDIDPLVTEQQLAHTVKDSLGRAYNRTTYMKQRTAMMQTWADYLDTLAAAKPVAAGKPAA